MADMFSKSDAERLLRNKHIVLIGDSNMRAIYKDLVCLLKEGTLIAAVDLKKKGETSFMGDTLQGYSGKVPTREYEEDRICITPCGAKIEFKFTTRVYSKKLEEKIHRLRHKPPHVILINSTLWDLTRWGPKGPEDFQRNLIELLEHLKRIKPALVVWLTALHPSSAQKEPSPLIVQELDQIKAFMQYDILEANNFASEKCKSYGYNVLDLHYHTRLLCHRRRPDGVHYTLTAVRYNTNLVLTHIALSWKVKLPGNVDCPSVEHIEEAIARQTNPGGNERGPSTSRNDDLDRDVANPLTSQSAIVQRKILHPKTRHASRQSTIAIISKSARDVIEECESLDLQQFFGPDY